MKNPKKQKTFLFLLVTLIGIFGSFLIYSCSEPLCVVPSSDNNRELPKNALIECNELPNIFDTKKNIESTLIYRQYYNNEEKSIFTLANLYDNYLFSISGGELANSANKIQAIRLQATLPTIDTTNADSSDEIPYTISIPIIDGAIDTSNTTASLQTVNNVRTLFFGLTAELKSAIKAISTETFKISIDYTIQYVDNITEDTKKLSLEVTTKPFTDIYTWQDLQAIQHNLDNNYAIKNKITFPKAGTEGFPSTGFIPLGDTDHPFTKNLDGEGNTISGLFIENTSDANIGLFGVISGSSTIKNITFSEVNLIASGTDANVGALAGTVMGGTLTGIKVQSGTIKGTNAGGLIGTIANTSTVELVGFNSDDDDSKADTATARKGSGAAITALANGSIGSIGGLVGAIVTNSDVTIIIGYSTAIVQGSLNGGITGTNIGGLIGSVSGSGSTSITIDGYTYGKVKSTSEKDNTGGVLGVTSNASLELTAISYSTVLGIENKNNLGWLIGANNANNATINGYWLNTQRVADGVSPSKAIGNVTTTTSSTTIKEIIYTANNSYENFNTDKWKWNQSSPPILQYPENNTTFFGEQLFLPSYKENSLEILYRNTLQPDSTPLPLTIGALYDSDSFTINMQTQLEELQLTYSYTTDTTDTNNVVSSPISYANTLANTEESDSITFGLKDFTNSDIFLRDNLLEVLSTTTTKITFIFTITDNNTNTYRGEIVIPVDANAIYTETDLQSMQYKLDGQYKLYTDITLTDSWTPIGNVDNSFAGSLQGWNTTSKPNIVRTISNFSISNTTNNPVGLFGVMNNTTSNPAIKNISIALKADTSCVSSPTECAIYNNNADVSVGVFVGILQAGHLEHLTINKDKDSSNTSTIYSSSATGFVGGFIGKMQSGTSATNLNNQGITIFTNATGTGGLVGYTENKVTIKNSSVANTTINGNAGGIGGLVGVMKGTADTNTTISDTSIKNSTIQDSSTSNVTIGGLVGIMTYGSLSLNDTSSSVSIIGGAESTIGGVIGTLKAGTLENLTNSFVSSITTDSNNACVSAGGLIGNIAQEGPVTVTGKNTLALELNCKTVGGLIGEINQHQEKIVVVGQNSSNISATTHAGGLIGYINSQKNTTQSSIAITGFSGAQVPEKTEIPTITEHTEIPTIIATGSSSDVYVGGLIGYLKTTEASNTTSSIIGYSNATVYASATNSNGTPNIGGLVGYVEVNNITLDGYSAGEVYNIASKTERLGWVIGYMANGTLSGNSYWKENKSSSSPDSTINYPLQRINLANNNNNNNTYQIADTFNNTLLTDTNNRKSFESITPVTLPILKHTTNPEFKFTDQPNINIPSPEIPALQVVANSIGPGIFLGERTLRISTTDSTTRFWIKSIGIGYEGSTDTTDANYVIQEGTDTNDFLNTAQTLVKPDQLFGIFIEDDKYPTQSTAAIIVGDFTRNTCGGAITIKVEYLENGEKDLQTIEETSKRDCDIENEDDLRGIAYDLTANYTLKNDILLSTKWEVLGPTTNTSNPPNKENAFTGSLVSDKDTIYTISNFFIYSDTSTYNPVGLFGVINSKKAPTLQGITIELAADGSTSAIENKNNTPAGAFAGLIKAGILKDLTVTPPPNQTSSITSDRANIGGIVGQINVATNSTVTVTNVYNNGVSINSTSSTSGTSSKDYVGGLVGKIEIDNKNTNNQIITGHVSGVAIKGNDYIGGLVGAATGKHTKIYGWIENSYITGNQYIGGLVGQVNDSTVKGYVKHNTSKENIIKGTSSAGGLVGKLTNSANLEGYTDSVNADVSSIYGSLVGSVEASSTVTGFVLNSPLKTLFGSIQTSTDLSGFSATGITTSASGNTLTITSNDKSTDSVSFTLDGGIGSWKKLDDENTPPLIIITDSPP